MDDATANDDRDASRAFCPGSPVTLQGASTGPLAGLTFAAKDLFDVAGHVTAGGNPDWARTHGPADSTAPAILELLDAGASLIGKTMTDDLACGMFGENLHFGTPLNSAFPDRVPGGSSSGSASAVAAGLCDFAIGTDTGGSVRAPASFCQIFSHRPSHGRVSLIGAIPMAPSFDSCGWFARDAEMLARVGNVLLPDDDAGSNGPILIAEDMLAIADTDVAGALRALLDEAGFTATATLLQRHRPADLYDAFWTIMSRQLWNSNGRWFERENPHLAIGLADRFRQAASVTGAARQAAEEIRRDLSRTLAEFFSDGRIILMPTIHAPPPVLNSPPEVLSAYRTRALSLIVVASLARLPQTTIPGVSVGGAHVGLSLLGGYGSDRRLLKAAVALAPRFAEAEAARRRKVAS